MRRQTSLVSSSHPFLYSRSVGAATEAASTSDSAMDRRLTRLGESSDESGASGSRLDSPSISELSRRSESVDSEGDEKVVSGVDYGNTESGGLDGTGDYDFTENGHIDMTSDQDIREKDSRDEMNDLDDSGQNGAPNGVNVDADNEEGRETMDVLKKNRKTKKNLEVNLDYVKYSRTSTDRCLYTKASYFCPG